MMERIHGSHLGIEKCIDRTKESLFWPGIIDTTFLERLAADLFIINQDKYMVLVDFYSTYFELFNLKYGRNETVINCLIQTMAKLAH